ncbi:MAG: DNA repair protein RadA [Deltaproteobacteria bacterium]|nr:DNA repair protein RadA [Deltaproteobacteria bacterium]
MKKSKVIYQFVCQHCGNSSPRWVGKCPSCDEWNSYVEERIEKSKADTIKQAWRPVPLPITEIEGGKEERLPTHIGELDRVLGGGFVPGSVVLVGGDPGIGKSTLALQMLTNIATSKLKVLYITGEESPEQVKLRAKRTGSGSDSLYVLAENSVDHVMEELAKLSPHVVVVDSIQTVYTEDFPSAPGSVGQIRECAARFMHYAKSKGTSIFLVGHVTKEGTIAGPRVLEHLVDTVLYFEGEREHPYRILRAVKNRYGSTNEIGVFEMQESGLKEVNNPSEIFLSERPIGASGSVVTPSIEGTRPILVEIQALVSPCNFGVPRRTTIGIDYNRVSLLVAVLEKRAGLNILAQDIFMNVAGGIKIVEPAVDLGVSISLVSSFLNKPIHHALVVFGEVGLSGEVRGVSHVELRLKEAEKLGFKKCILPRINIERIKSSVSSLSLVGVGSIENAIEAIF